MSDKAGHGHGHGQISYLNKVSTVGLLVTLGIVYGDIGTSPLYVMRAIISGAAIEPNFILGALSCVIWTLTLQTTIKYVLITLRADNKGEGGILSLFALVRKNYRWAYILAIVGGSALLADGIITPAITVVSAVEGIELISPGIPIIPIVLVIITLLFVIQQFGTMKVGKSFGPIMFFWFLMLGVLGFFQVIQHPVILKAFNPYYAYNFITAYPKGFILLGAVFLCTTGAEALYSDLGHCGYANIRITWAYVKIMLLTNYLGQGAWILEHPNEITSDLNPFYAIMPSWFLIPGIIIATMAAVIASQALITGSFTLISEAISLNFWPRLKKLYPTFVKGQVYIPAINWFLYFACCIVILMFKESAKMEAAYGLSITITMLMTTFLLTIYLNSLKVNKILVGLVFFVFFSIEMSFLIANFDKFSNGGWFTLLLASLVFIIMYGWYNARRIRNRHLVFVNLNDYIEIIKEMSQDKSIPKYATNLVFISRADTKEEIESKIVYSIINKQPKRADVYWFLHIDILDSPNTFEYEVVQFVPRKVIKVDFRLGFKVEPRVDLYFKQVLADMIQNDEIDAFSRYDSLRKYNIDADTKFIVIDRIPNLGFNFSAHEKFIMGIFKLLKRLGVSEVKAFGLDTSNVLVEKVPMMNEESNTKKLISRRIS